MKNIAILQPSELGEDFKFDLESGVWGITFPPSVDSDVVISPNTNNLITTGTDGGAHVLASKLIAHALVQDTEEQKIHLYRFPAGTEFSVGAATLVGSIDMVEMNGVFDDIAIAGNIITFKDAQTNTSITLDTDTLQRVSRIGSTNSIRATTVGGAVTLEAIVSSIPGNLLTSSVAGLEVSQTGVSDYVKLLLAGVNSQQSIRLTVAGDTAKVTRTIGKQAIDIPQFSLVGSAGQHLAYGDDITTALVGHPVVG